MLSLRKLCGTALLLLVSAPLVVAEETEKLATLNSADTVWMLICTALVLFMTISGLALFCSGMVCSKKII